MKQFFLAAIIFICIAFAGREPKRYRVSLEYTQQEWNAHLDTLAMLNYYIGKPMMHMDAETLQGWIGRMRAEIVGQVGEQIKRDSLAKR